ncbi:FAD-binding oxidoreductase [Neptunicoccus cionae]|uniref:FAD-binding oxidoreductase n=1 Tax=Neptunicoccus cionae TaxID=2035344 RepID=UPI0015E0C79D|nr:FAD-binding oxidoreductase [Amylibacter cionae]
MALPRSTEDVATLLRMCNDAGIPVVPQGGLTGLVGGAMPSADCVVINLSRLAPAPKINRDARIAEVGAGTVLETLQQAAADAGLVFPVEFGARGSCEIGGMIATNAGGVHVLRYGMMRDQVLGLEAVLADGTVVTSMNPLKKNNTGYDLRQIFIGSEGTLGIITRAHLRLVPIEPARAVALLRVPDTAAAHRLLDMLKTSVPVNAFEVMWPSYYAYACETTGTEPIAAGEGVLLLVEITGPDEAALQEALLTALVPWMENGVIEDAVLSQSEAQAQALWDIREANEALSTKYRNIIGFDVSLPRAQMQAFHDECIDALARLAPGSQMMCFGHLGDGNLHLAVILDGAPDADATTLKSRILTAAGARSGAISAEHGIGTDKLAWLHLSRSPEEIGMMRRIKTALDPKNILNPGKLLPPVSSAT